MKKSRLFLSLLLLSSVIFLISHFVLETDYFWHIKVGEYMFKNGVLTRDVFSWSVYGKYWVSHEWLFEVLLYGLKVLFGKYHSILYAGGCLTILFSIILILNKNKISKNIFYTTIYFVLFIAMSLGFIQARPHLLSFLLVAVSIYLCFDLYKNKDSKKIYLLPFISILWANIHGGSSNLSYIFCSVFLICGLIDIRLKKIESIRISKKQICRYLIVLVLCMIGICINPHGFKMFIYPYVNILDTTMINTILEWQSTTICNMTHWIYYIYMLFIIITLLLSSKKIRLIDLVLLVFVSYLGFKSIRFWLYSPIIMSFIIFDYVKEIKTSLWVTYVFSIVLVLVCVFGLYDFRQIKLINHLNLDKKAIKVLKKEKPKRLFNEYDYGGELIYYDIPVFIDGRADLYSRYNYKDYLDISSCSDNYNELTSKYNFDYLLLGKKYSLYGCLDKNMYEKIYENEELIIYKKAVN